MIDNLIAYAVAAFGLAYILGHAVVTRALREWAFDLVVFENKRGDGFLPLRWLVMLVECPACLGFWEGLIAGAVFGHITEMPRLLHVGTAFALACFTTGTNFMLGRAFGLIKLSHKENA